MVASVLREVPATRNSDITLTIEIWKRFFPNRIKDARYILIADLYELPREDNVKRARAYFQNTKKVYLPTDWAIAKRRGILEDEWRVALDFPTKETTGKKNPSWTPPSEVGTKQYAVLQSENENKTVSKMQEESVPKAQSDLGF